MARVTRPGIFGIVNITSDSFSDGGRFLAPDAAIAQARKLMAEGADAIDLGPASSNPDAAPVSSDEEIRRLTPVLAALTADGVPVSIDSFQPETQDWALRQGVAYLNDIRGFPERALYPALAASSARLIVMHSIQQGQADRRAAPEGDIVGHILNFFEGRIAALEEAGVARERLILDPGMGFFLGPTPATSLAVLARLGEIKDRFGLPLLVSVSRKSFLRALTGRPAGEAGPASRAAELLATENGADFLRTHEPAPLRDALAVWAALKDSARIR
jgi:dihydropteroate synthase type 2